MSRPGATESRLPRWIRDVIDEPTPLVKQLPTVIAVIVALILTLTVPDLAVLSRSIAYPGVLLVVIATVAAWIMSRRSMSEGWIVLLVPIVDILGLGLFRMGTGGSGSLFTAFVLLPIVWLAAAPGRRMVLLVALLTSLTLILPYFFDPPARAVDWLRGVITPIVFGAVAAIINELSRRARERVEEAERLASERAAALAAEEQALEQVRQSEEKFRSMVDLYDNLWHSITMQAVIVTDRTGLVVQWNPGAQRLLGLTNAEAVGHARIERFLPEHVRADLTTRTGRPADDAIAALFERAESEEGIDGDHDVATATGTTFPARVTVTPFKGAEGGTQGYLFVISDESRAAEVARMKDEFVGMISHELRTPLSSIMGFVDLLQHDPESPLTPDQLGFVAVIERNAQRLLALVSDLLFTAQVESGRFPIDRVQMDVADVVRNSITSAGPHAAQEGITLAVDAPPHPLHIVADAGRIGQAVDNLLSNALKFTPSGGTVTAAVHERDGSIEISVRDTGMGIPAAEQEMLFTRFFRASTATRAAVPGVGLGLAITRAIVHAHGGAMEFESEEGVGTEFRIVLPAAPRTEAIPLPG